MPAERSTSMRARSSMQRPSRRSSARPWHSMPPARRSRRRSASPRALATAPIEARGADRLVGLVAAHLHLVALVYALTLRVVADHHRGLLAAAADGLHFLQRIRDREQL